VEGHEKEGGKKDGLLPRYVGRSDTDLMKELKAEFDYSKLGERARMEGSVVWW
jgi:hypothetical protein